MKRSVFIFTVGLTSGGVTSATFAENVSGVSGYVRIGLISAEDESGDRSDGSAIGGKLG
ncbi:MAG: hypothetical protein AB2792_16780 [Candidatus Thiodiazotropha sp.]